MSESQRPLRLVIVGRPNVGKSTLFNRLLGRRRALVHDEPGVTRDRLEEKAKWWVKGKEFPVLLVDTGGLGGERFAEEIQNQVQIALRDADIVIALFDAQSGLTGLDREVLKQLKRSGLFDRKDKQIIGVVNKVDVESHEIRIADFYAAGLDPIVTISAEHGRGIADLQELIGELCSEYVEADAETNADESEVNDSDDLDSTEKSLDGELKNLASVPGAVPGGIPRIAILGRPNVGKSTLVNALTGQDRMIASPIAGTTIDSVDSPAVLGGEPFLLIDTAGIRRKSKTEQGVEVLSVVQSRKALERCDVAVLLLDAESGIIDQDEKIGGLIEDAGCGVILVVNKWDIQRKKKEINREVAAEIIRKKMAYLRYAPILFVSAKEGRGLEDLGGLVLEILEQRRAKVSTREFTDWVRDQSRIHNPKNAKFYMCHQSGRHPPTFVCHVSDPDKIHFSLRRNLMNGIREKWGYMGNPVRLLFVKGTSTRTTDPTKRRKAGFTKSARAQRKKR